MVALTLSFVIAILDQLSKDQITSQFCLGEPHPVISGFFNLTYVRNTGAAWGMFGGWNIWLAVLSLAILAVLVIFRRSFLVDCLLHRVALGLMIGGIVGNLFDRIRLGYVVDFLDFRFGTYAFPAFNVADSAICIGVAIYALSSLHLPSHPLRDVRRDAGDAGTKGSASAPPPAA